MFKQLHVVSKVTCFFFSRLKKAEFEWSSKLQGNISQNLKKKLFLASKIYYKHRGTV